MPMYEVTIKADFSAAHNLREVGGKCESLHGHNFKVEVAVEAEALDEAGMVIDFRFLKEKTRALLEGIDHRYLNELPLFQGKNPSAENVAFHLFHELSRQINQGSRKVSWVAVWESDTSRAVFRGSKK
jgi:6-pyruvoyltetrahydropterin/6-carboxytetrahydropterin synthase